MARNARAAVEELLDEFPEARAEYDRLGPRYAAVGEIIKARTRAGLTQRELARRMGVSQAVIARLESAEHSPLLDTLVAVADALDCELQLRFKRRRKAAAADATHEVGR